MVAQIFSPAKNAMQSGDKRTGYWLLKYLPEDQKLIEPLMGYTSSWDTQADLKIRFETKEEAIAFAKKNRIAYVVTDPQPVVRQKKSYADNFSFDRKLPWTH